ncbi:hypothetical protein [Nocardia bovistercoris]|uniref:DUF8020 domain-containing protein n=1 Tax=Nocardia bovistercoris TaxID=2785916 RepID=A0A931IFX3_9NOCA|nr:hypothetical protein [Nocardia bovistercoris]MBH0780987.1 hypothetical protein [Nocardia bovistercoris]
MRVSRITATAILALGAIGLGTGIAPAEPTQPAPSYLRDGEGPLHLEGEFQRVGYDVAASEDRRSVTTVLRDGRFHLVEDGRVVTVTDRDGQVLAALPMAVRVGDRRVEIRPIVDPAGTTLTLAPAAIADTPIRDISAQERFFAEVERHMPQVVAGAAIGAAIGFVLGFPLGLFIFDIVTVPITTVVGGVIGAFAGLYAGGGQPAIDSALEYMQGAP